MAFNGWIYNKNQMPGGGIMSDFVKKTIGGW